MIFPCSVSYVILSDCVGRRMRYPWTMIVVMGFMIFLFFCWRSFRKVWSEVPGIQADTPKIYSNSWKEAQMIIFDEWQEIIIEWCTHEIIRVGKQKHIVVQYDTGISRRAIHHCTWLLHKASIGVWTIQFLGEQQRTVTKSKKLLILTLYQTIQKCGIHTLNIGIIIMITIHSNGYKNWIQGDDRAIPQEWVHAKKRHWFIWNQCLCYCIQDDCSVFRLCFLLLYILASARLRASSKSEDFGTHSIP